MELDDLLCLTFAILTGYVNTITLIRYGVFAAGLTGNLIFVAMTVYRCQAPELHTHGCSSEFWEALFCFAIITSNLLGVCTVCAVFEWRSQRPLQFCAPVLAVLMVASDAVQEVCIQLRGVDDGVEEEASQWSICCIAFAMGGFNFLALPAAPNARLKTVTHAATSHLQTNAALLFRWLRGSSFSAAQRRSASRACLVVVGLTIGVVLGALALLCNPLGPPADRWLFTVGAALQLATLLAHPDEPMLAAAAAALKEPLHPSPSSVAAPAP